MPTNGKLAFQATLVRWEGLAKCNQKKPRLSYRQIFTFSGEIVIVGSERF